MPGMSREWCQATSLTDRSSCDAYMLAQQDLLFVIQGAEDRRSRRLVRLATRPGAGRLGTDLLPLSRPAIAQSIAVAPALRLRPLLHLASDLDQHAPRANHRLPRCRRLGRPQ